MLNTYGHLFIFCNCFRFIKYYLDIGQIQERGRIIKDLAWYSRQILKEILNYIINNIIKYNI